MVGYNTTHSTEYIFPTPIHFFYIEGFENIKNKLIDYAYDFKKRYPKGRVISNRGGWQSPISRVVQDGDLLSTLLFNSLTSIPHIKEDNVYIISSWININKSGDYNIKHSHPNCDLSGVFWIKTPENCGNLEFDNPTMFEEYDLVNSCTDEFKDYSKFHHSWIYQPIEGRGLVFPSHLNHHVHENKSNDDRISVSFNIRLCSIEY